MRQDGGLDYKSRTDLSVKVLVFFEFGERNSHLNRLSTET